MESISIKPIPDENLGKK